MEILILHPGALGDIILSLPAIKTLRGRWPDARITLAANTDFAFAVATGYADHIESLSALPLHRLHASGPLPSEDQWFWLRYGRILSWTGRSSEFFASNLSKIHPAAIVADWKPHSGDRRHVSRIFADSLRTWLSPPSVLPEPEIMIDPPACRWAAEWLGSQGWRSGDPLVALHPGAGGAAKRWPPARFCELARRLQPQARLLIIEGPAEPDLGRDLQAELPGAMLARLSVRLLSAVLSHCRLYVGNDSGVAHLAAALRIPAVVLFGPAQPIHWAPLGKHVRVLWDQHGCASCGSVQDPGAAHTCLNSISVEEVLEASLECGALALQ